MKEVVIINLDYELIGKVSVAGVPILIGVIGTIIRVRAHFLNKKKASHDMKHNLYDKRFKVFSFYRDFLKEGITEDEISIERYNEFSSLIAESNFLFKSEIVKEMNEAYKEISELEKVKRKLYYSEPRFFNDSDIGKDLIELREYAAGLIDSFESQASDAELLALKELVMSVDETKSDYERGNVEKKFLSEDEKNDLLEKEKNLSISLITKGNELKSNFREYFDFSEVS